MSLTLRTKFHLHPAPNDQSVSVSVSVSVSTNQSVLFSAVHYVQCSKDQWIANTPRRLPALQGSCVVIPCTYMYPKPKSGQILNRFRGFWKLGRKIISSNLPKWKVFQEFKKRTQFLGDLRSQNCTMLLDGVRQTDVGPFYFRIEMPQYKSFSYTGNSVSIDVLREYCGNYINHFWQDFTH